MLEPLVEVGVQLVIESTVVENTAVEITVCPVAGPCTTDRQMIWEYPVARLLPVLLNLAGNLA